MRLRLGVYVCTQGGRDNIKLHISRCIFREYIGSSAVVSSVTLVAVVEMVVIFLRCLPLLDPRDLTSGEGSCSNAYGLRCGCSFVRARVCRVKRLGCLEYLLVVFKQLGRGNGKYMHMTGTYREE